MTDPAPARRARVGLPARLLALAGLLQLAGCAQTYTIRELGYPAFEPVTGAETRFARPDPEQVQGLDAYPDTADRERPHRFVISPVPIGNELAVCVEIRAVGKPGSVPVTALAGLVYPLDPSGAGAFRLRGTLPPGVEPLCFAQSRERDGADGPVVLQLVFPREALPPGVERLAVPILAQFEDGWIHVRYFDTPVPMPVPLLDEQGNRIDLESEAGQRVVRERVEADLAALAGACRKFREVYTRWPAKLEELWNLPPGAAGRTEPFLPPPHPPRDPWGGAFEVVDVDGAPALRSLGADGRPGGEGGAADVTLALGGA